jgi:adenylate kinase family enzyme
MMTSVEGQRLPFRRVHIAGAPGGGTTTIGRALATQLSIPHFDADDFYWMPTNPPYRQPRPRTDRVRLMRELFLDRDAWVFSSGNIESWAPEIVPSIDIIAFLIVPTDVRMERLRLRQDRQFGSSAVAPSGWNHANTLDLYSVAAGYDDGTAKGRTRPRHEAWFASLTCQIVRIDGTRPVQQIVTEIAGHLPLL